MHASIRRTLAAVMLGATVLAGCGFIVDKKEVVSGTSEQGRSDGARCRTEARTLQTATEAYFAQTGGYPKDIETLVEAGFLHDADSLYRVEGPGGATEPTFTPIEEDGEPVCPEIAGS